MKVTDITGWIYSGMWSYCKEYPGADVSELPQPDFLKGRYSVFCQKFVIGGQSGTYIETKAHVESGAVPVTAHAASEFFFACRIVRLGRKAPSEKITLAEIKACSPSIRKGDAVILSCGWDAKWHDDDFVSSSPYMSYEAGLWLIEKGIKLLGSDFPRLDNPEKPEFPWDEFWRKVTFLLAPVVNISGITGSSGRLIALPLKIKGAAAAPVRAVVIE